MQSGKATYVLWRLHAMASVYCFLGKGPRQFAQNPSRHDA